MIPIIIICVSVSSYSKLSRHSFCSFLSEKLHNSLTLCKRVTKCVSGVIKLSFYHGKGEGEVKSIFNCTTGLGKCILISTFDYLQNGMTRTLSFISVITVPEIWRLHLEKQEENSSNKHQNKWFLLGNLRTIMQLDKTCLMTWNNHLKSHVFCISFSSRQLHV